MRCLLQLNGDKIQLTDRRTATLSSTEGQAIKRLYR